MSVRKIGNLVIALAATATLNTVDAFTCPENGVIAKSLDAFASKGQVHLPLSKDPTVTNKPLYLAMENQTKNNFNGKLLGTQKALGDFLKANRDEMTSEISKLDPSKSQEQINLHKGMMNPRIRQLGSDNNICSYTVSVGKQNAVIALSEKSGPVRPNQPLPSLDTAHKANPPSRPTQPLPSLDATTQGD